jgi:small GTP-binding protein
LNEFLSLKQEQLNSRATNFIFKRIMSAHKIFLFGLDRAGKTALSNYIKTNTCGTTKPTLAFNLDKWIIDDIDFQVWDAPGQLKLRSMWKNGFEKAKILLFVLDTADLNRFEESKEEFMKVINSLETAHIPLVFCFHKMDLPEAKANFNKAREIFKLPLLKERDVTTFETTINGCEAIDQLKAKLVDLIQNARW